MARFTPEVKPKSSALMISRRKRSVYQRFVCERFVWRGSLARVVLDEQQVSASFLRAGGTGAALINFLVLTAVTVTVAFAPKLEKALARRPDLTRLSA